MANPVKFIASSMPGTPVITGAGFADFIAMLDFVLVNGGNLKAIDTLTRTGSEVTAVINAGHDYQPNTVVTIAGFDQAEYNGEQLITAVTATSFTYTITGTPATPGTGTTKTAKIAPLGFNIEFTGTNKRVYRSPNVLGSRPRLRVDASQLSGYGAGWAKFARVTIADVMTGIDTFTGVKAPYDILATTKNEARTGAAAPYYYGWYKWYAAHAWNGSDETAPDTNPKPWYVIGDDRGFWLFIGACNPDNASATVKWLMYGFGEFNSLKTADAYNVQLIATEAYLTSTDYIDDYWRGYYTPGAYFGYYQNPNYPGAVVLRDFTQLGNPLNFWHTALHVSGSVAGCYSGTNSSVVPMPNGPDFSLLLHPMYIQTGNGNIRGTQAGLYAILNGGEANMYTPGTIVDNVAGYAGRKLVIMPVVYPDGSGNSRCRVAVDITGPWR